MEEKTDFIEDYMEDLEQVQFYPSLDFSSAMMKKFDFDDMDDDLDDSYSMDYGEQTEEEETFVDDMDDVYTSNDLQTYLKDISKYPLLTVEEERDLLVRAKSGDQDAREKLICSNLRFVVSIAKHFRNRGVDFLDLIQEGNLGLMKTIDKFNLDYDNCLSTYAERWIRAKIIRSIYDKSKTIRVPVYLSEKITQYRKVIELYLKAYGREPSDEEFLSALHIKKEKLSELREAMGINMVSTEVPVRLGESTRVIGDYIPDENTNIEEEVLSPSIYDVMFEEVEKRLNSQQIDVLKKRLGFLGEVKTLESIAETYDISHERVRQIQEEAIKKLAPLTKKKLKDALYH